MDKIKQIKVLEEAKVRIASGRNKSLREAIFVASHRLFSEKSNIPLLTFSNAQIACKSKKVKMPNVELSDWFEPENKTSRYAVINWIVEQLKK